MKKKCKQILKLLKEIAKEECKCDIFVHSIYKKKEDRKRKNIIKSCSFFTCKRCLILNEISDKAESYHKESIEKKEEELKPSLIKKLEEEEKLMLERDKRIKIGEVIFNNNKEEIIKKYKDCFIAIDMEKGVVVASGTSPLQTIKRAKKIENKPYYLKKIKHEKENIH